MYDAGKADHQPLLAERLSIVPNEGITARKIMENTVLLGSTILVAHELLKDQTAPNGRQFQDDATELFH